MKWASETPSWVVWKVKKSRPNTCEPEIPYFPHIFPCFHVVFSIFSHIFPMFSPLFYHQCPEIVQDLSCDAYHLPAEPSRNVRRLEGGDLDVLGDVRTLRMAGREAGDLGNGAWNGEKMRRWWEYYRVSLMGHNLWWDNGYIMVIG